MIITFSSAIIFAGDVIMIDLATPIDTLPLFNFSHWTDEEIDAFIADDVLIEMKCIECGHIAKVPD